MSRDRAARGQEQADDERERHVRRRDGQREEEAGGHRRHQGRIAQPGEHLAACADGRRRTGRADAAPDLGGEAVAAADEEADRAQVGEPGRPGEEVARDDDEAVADRDARERRPLGHAGEAEPRAEDGELELLARCDLVPKVAEARHDEGGDRRGRRPELAGRGRLDRGRQPRVGGRAARDGGHLGRIHRDQDEARATIGADEGDVRIGPDAGDGGHAVDRRQV